MLHDQFINFLEATVIALTLANAFAVIVAATAISMARDQREPGLKTRGLAQPLRLLVSRRVRQRLAAAAHVSRSMQVVPQRVAHSAVAISGELQRYSQPQSAEVA